MSFNIHTEIFISASRDFVWKVLIDFENYSKWNTFIPKINGTLEPDSILNIMLVPVNSKPQPYKVKVLEVRRNEKLSWLGHFYIPGLIDGHHTIELLEETNETTKLIHKETFSGLLVPFVKQRFLQEKLLPAFNEFNIGLKQFIEKILKL